MGLKFRLRPGERLAINGAVVRNPAERPMEIEVMNPAALLHEKDVMQPEQADDPLKKVYLYLQLMLLEPEKRSVYADSYGMMLALARHDAQTKADENLLKLYDAVDALVRREDCFSALRQIQSVIGRPGAGRQQDK